VGVMLRLKKNIGGETLLRAYRCLLARPEHRRVLTVISDSAR
jgi:cobaltochelatase CobT